MGLIWPFPGIRPFQTPPLDFIGIIVWNLRAGQSELLTISIKSVCGVKQILIICHGPNVAVISL